MMFLNINLVIIFVIVLLSDKGLSPIKRRKPASLSDSDIPEQVTDIFAERNQCEGDINAVFDKNLSAYDHAVHAIKNLTINNKDLNYFANKYYYSFNRRLRPGRIISVAAYCRLHKINNFCNDSITEFFNASTPLHILKSAFYDTNLRMAIEKKAEHVINYYHLILEGFELQLETQPSTFCRKPFPTPKELCKDLIKMPKRFKDYDITLTL